MQKNWASIQDLFCRLNRSGINYIVLRNYESLANNDIFVGEHDDIDFLCDNIYKMIKLLDARPIYRFPNRNSYIIRFQNRDLQVDVRYIGDGYYDTDWEKALLKRKVIFNNFIYVIDNKMYFYTLIYHAIYQKFFLSDEYFLRLKKMAKKSGKNITQKKQLEYILFIFMKKMGYKFTYTKDPGIILNFRNVPMNMICFNPYRILKRKLLKCLNKLFMEGE